MTDLARQNADLLAANNRYLERARAAEARVDELERALRAAARNDKSVYVHHEMRPFDDLRPQDDDSVPPDQRGTIWLTPREIARRVLREPDLATLHEALKAVRKP
jgi:hypothetical protein